MNKFKVFVKIIGEIQTFISIWYPSQNCPGTATELRCVGELNKKQIIKSTRPNTRKHEINMITQTSE